MLAQRRALVLAAALELGDDRFGLPLRLDEHLARVLLRLAHGALPLRLQLPLHPLGLVPKRLGLPVRLFRQLALLFGDLSVIFGVGDHVFEADLLLAQPVAGALDQVFGEPQLSRDLKGVGLARHADGQPVRGPKRLHIELHRRVLDAPGGQREGLELGVVGGRKRCGLHRQQVLQDRHRQRRALGRVGARAQLVEQHQRSGRDVFQDLDDVRHVGRERGERLLDGLLVADVGEHFVEDCKLGAEVRGHTEARLCHQRHEPHRLHRDGLAAGVGAGDDERRKLAAHPQVDGHHLRGVDQRMPPRDDVDAPLGVQLWFHRLHLAAEECLGEDHVELRQDVQVVYDEVGVRRDLGGERGQDALDLLFLLRRPLLQVVARLHHRHRLDEQRRAACGLVVNQPGDIGAALGLDRQHIAAVALGDDGVLQILGLLAPQKGVQLFAHPVSEEAKVTPDVVELGAGAVGDLILGQNGVEDGLLKLPVGVQVRRQLRQKRRVLPVSDDGLPHQARGLERLRDVQKRLRRQRTARRGDLDEARHVRKILHRRPAGVGHDGTGLRGLTLPHAHHLLVAGGHQRLRALPAQFGQAQRRQLVAYLGKLENPKVSLSHKGHSTPLK